MSIEIPDGFNRLKYVWVQHDGKDYVKFTHTKIQHPFIFDMIRTESGTPEIRQKHIMDAGYATIDREGREIYLTMCSISYDDKSNPKDFKALIEDETDYKVDIDF